MNAEVFTIFVVLGAFLFMWNFMLPPRRNAYDSQESERLLRCPHDVCMERA